MKQTLVMKVFGSLCLLALVFLAAPTASPSKTGRSTSHREDYCAGEICAGLRLGVDITEINALYGTYIKERIPGSNIYLLGLPPGRNLEKVMDRMNVDFNLLFAEYNQQFQLTEVQQTSHAFIDQVSHAFIDGQSPAAFYGQQSVEDLQLDEAHQFSRGFGVRVAVIDTGLDFNHSAFEGKIAGPGYDFVDDDGNPSEINDQFIFLKCIAGVIQFIFRNGTAFFLAIPGPTFFKTTSLNPCLPSWRRALDTERSAAYSF